MLARLEFAHDDKFAVLAASRSIAMQLTIMHPSEVVVTAGNVAVDVAVVAVSFAFWLNGLVESTFLKPNTIAQIWSPGSLKSGRCSVTSPSTDANL